MEPKKNKITFNPFFDQHPTGAIEINQGIQLSLHIPIHFRIWDLKLIINDDTGQVKHVIPFDRVVSFQINEAGIFWYYFEFSDCFGTHKLISDAHHDAIISDSHIACWQLSVHYPFTDTTWFKGKIIYHLMVDRFYKGANHQPKAGVQLHNRWNDDVLYEYDSPSTFNNDFFGGDLVGIIKKLPYLKQLNVGIIYLSPIFEAYSNHKYDTGDYLTIDSMFGNEDDFKKLCQEAKQLGIEIFIDCVFNHSGDRSIYFNKYNTYPSLGAYQSKESSYYDWYHFKDHPDDYESWWGIRSLPRFNQANPNYIQLIDTVLNKWLRLGVKGIRLDVVDELSNELVVHIAKTTKQIGHDIVIIGEVWEDASNKMAYGVRKHYFRGNQLDSVMNYVFRNAIIDYLKHHRLTTLKDCIRRIIAHYPKQVLDRMMNILDTHDTERIINAFYQHHPHSKKAQSLYRPSEEEHQQAIRKMKMATILQYTLPGVPSIFYGDEAGQTGFEDPFCRRPFPWDQINENLLSWYQRLGEIRKDVSLVDGIYQEIDARHDIFIYSRVSDTSELVIIINNSNMDLIYPIVGVDLFLQKNISEVFVPKQTGTIIKVK